MTDDVFVRLVKLPSGIHEVVMPCSEGYCIYIDNRLDQPHQIEAYRHALKHIHNEDWNKNSVQEIEAEAHERK